jgi:hypothetical protein
LRQADRILDPTLAVSKYKRSAAGGGISSHTTTQQQQQQQLHRNREQLQDTLGHLIHIAATGQATSQHPIIVDIHISSEFLVDRLRACQADATRLLGKKDDNDNNDIDIDIDNDIDDGPPLVLLPSTWHAQMARLLIWIRYWTTPPLDNNSTQQPQPQQVDAWMPRTLSTMLSSALEQYWMAREEEEEEEPWNNEEDTWALDDEMLCWSAMSRLALPNHDGSLNNLLLEYSKHVVDGGGHHHYPLFQLSLRIASHFVRQEYYPIWKLDNNDNDNDDQNHQYIPILAKCCLAPSLFSWRYTMVQHYNVSFAKHEKVADMDRLLGVLPEPLGYWSYDYAQASFGGIPVETREEDGAVVMILKKVAMSDDPPLPPSSRRHREDAWVFGRHYQPDETTMGMSSELILELLQTGHVVVVKDVISD